MQNVVILLFLFLFLSASSFSQSGDRGKPAGKDSKADQTESSEIPAINAIAKKHRSGTINIEAIRKEIQGQNALSSMSVQAALDKVMTRIQQNAEKDFDYASVSVRSATEKKDSLKRRAEELKGNHEDLRNRLKNEYDTLKAASAYSNRRKAELAKVLNQEKLSETNVETAAKRKKDAESHLQSVKDAFRKAQQIQSQ